MLLAARLTFALLVLAIPAAQTESPKQQAVAPPPAAETFETVEGAVLGAEGTQLTVEAADGRLATFAVTAGTEFRGVDALRDLEPGDRVCVTSRPSASGREATVIELASVAGVVGVIEKLGDNQFTVKRQADGALVNVLVNDETHYHGPQLGIRFKDLRPGDRVIAVVKPGKTRVAELVDVTGGAPSRPRTNSPGEAETLVGRVEKVSADRLTLHRSDGRLVTLRLTSRTRFEGHGARSWKDCRVGESVAVAAKVSGGVLVATTVDRLGSAASRKSK